MPKRTTEKRRLIKFSNYSMCITLPKWVIDQLEWKKGDELTLTTDVKQGKITLYKRDDASSDKEEVTEERSEPPEVAEQAPKLRW